MAVCAKLLRQNVVKYNRTLSTFSALGSQVKLTSERYPNLARGNFATLDDSDLKQFENILDAGRVITDSSEVAGYNEDWLRTVRGRAGACSNHGILTRWRGSLPTVGPGGWPSAREGGNTGLVGGSVPVFDEVIVSTQLMNKLRTLTPPAVLLCANLEWC
eukprot:TRINITY_DN36429_c0_g1_i1.p1 TRINITY_DN36429_c0_g1~~TRINITY_DN36429_c0_g1_i1.p1  ORF type:complete len:160 (+),score=6.08 TRINITY_DN36429_c0_g1_i1:11-490(+)